jgi:hypothetical protein
VTTTHYKAYALSDEEREALIACIHFAQDNFTPAADELAGSSNSEDVERARCWDKQLDLLDALRKKLGDTWEPTPEFRVPDTPEGLT